MHFQVKYNLKFNHFNTLERQSKLVKQVKHPIVFFLLSYFFLLFSAGIGCRLVLSLQNLSNAFFSEQGSYLHRQ